MILDVYYENCQGKYWEKEKSIPYMVLIHNKEIREQLNNLLKSSGFQCVSWNDNYPGILVNMDLKRFGMINRPCKHSCRDSKNYSYDEFIKEVWTN